MHAHERRPPYHAMHPPFLASPQDRAYWEVTVEKLAARCGRFHRLREGDMCIKRHDPGRQIRLPAVEDDEWLREHNNKR